ncbi:MAG: hypothetical protein V1866_04290 [archaeon]
MTGRATLAYRELKFRLKIQNFIGNIDRNGIRVAHNKIAKLDKFIEKYGKIAIDLDKQVKNLAAEGVEKDFIQLNKIYRDEFQIVDEAFISIILTLRREFIRLKKIHQLEKNKETKDKEEEIMMEFTKLNDVFANMQQFDSFTPQFSDVITKLKETEHRLNMMNGQIEARKIFKEEKKVKKDEKKELRASNPKKVNKAVEIEKADLGKLGNDLSGYLKFIRDSLNILIRFMQMEWDKHEKDLRGFLTLLDQGEGHAKYPLPYYNIIKKEYEKTETKVKESKEDITDALRALTQSIIRSR